MYMWGGVYKPLISFSFCKNIREQKLIEKLKFSNSINLIMIKVSLNNLKNLFNTIV